MMRHQTIAAIVMALAATQCADGSVPADDLPPLVEASLPRARFPHDAHVTEHKLACRACHHETNAARLETPHPGYLEDQGIQCVTCHHKDEEPRAAQACSACHHDSPTEVADETSSAKVVIHRTCWRCHPVGAGADASDACTSCHVDPSVAQPPAVPLAPGIGRQP